MKKNVKVAVVCLALVMSVFLFSGMAMAAAALDWSDNTVNTEDVVEYTEIAAVGLGTLWGIRKVIKTMNRS